MQRSPQSNAPNAQTVQNAQNSQRDASYISPAYTMAARIRNEQGKERAGEYLAAMEPFLAPGERAHIAAQLGVPLVQRPGPPPPPYQQAPPYQQQYQQQVPPMFSQFNQQGGVNDSTMQLMQMISALGGMNGGKGKAPDMGAMNSTMMLAQLIGMMGKK